MFFLYFRCFYFQGDLDVQVSHIRAESRLHVEEGDIHLRLSDAHPLKVRTFISDYQMLILLK